MESFADRLSLRSVALIVVSCTGGLLFGYDTGVISGAMILMRSERDNCPRYGGYGLSDFQVEVVVDSTIGGAILGAGIGGWAADLYGRHRVLTISAILFTLGSLMLGLAMNFITLIFGRIIVGIAIGFASHTVPVYLGECAQPQIRGKVLGCFNAFVVFGQILAGILDGAFFYVHNGWRLMLGFGAVFSTFQLIGLLFLPESPRYLFKNGNSERAARVLSTLRPPGYDTSAELSEWRANINDEESNLSFKEIFESHSIRASLALGCGVQCLQQFAGINTVMYYSASILQDAGFGGSDSICCCAKDAIPIWLSISTATAQFVGVLIGQYLSDSWGRRPLLLSSCLAAALFLGLLGTGFLLQDKESNGSQSLTLVALLGYLVAFGWGLATIPWTLNGEIYPMKARAKCATLASMCNWMSNFIVSGSFLTLTDTKLKTQGTFWLLGSIAIIGFFWLLVAMPETKGRTLNEIADIFQNLSGEPHESYTPLANENAMRTPLVVNNSVSKP
ncbi:hypothetical protein AAMO2058_001374700 [Amorphochlora amoebiformis]